MRLKWWKRRGGLPGGVDGVVDSNPICTRAMGSDMGRQSKTKKILCFQYVVAEGVSALLAKNLRRINGL
jgi:hypothetical protein